MQDSASSGACSPQSLSIHSKGCEYEKPHLRHGGRAAVGGFALTAAAGEPEKYTLRYKFQPGETIRWEVEHLSMVRATVSRHTQTTETSSTSLKAWRVADVRPDGTATFEHRVEWVDMRQKLTGRDEVHYDSRTDGQAAAGLRDRRPVGRRPAGDRDHRPRTARSSSGSGIRVSKTTPRAIRRPPTSRPRTRAG